MYDANWLTLIGIVLFLIWAIYTIQEGLWPNQYLQNTQQYLIIIVKNMEDVIEGLMWDILVLHREMESGELIVIDANSTDKTLKVIEKMNYANMFTSILVNDQQQLKALLDEYNRHNCLIIDYRANCRGLLKNIAICKCIVNCSGKV